MSHSPHEQKAAPSPYKQRTPSSTRCQVSRVAPPQETYLAQTHLHKTEATGNDAHQNVLATWTEVKTLQEQQNSHILRNTQTNMDLRNTTLEYGFHCKHRNPISFRTERFAHDCRRILVKKGEGVCGVTFPTATNIPW
jgi:hypothetical protein